MRTIVYPEIREGQSRLVKEMKTKERRTNKEKSAATFEFINNDTVHSTDTTSAIFSDVTYKSTLFWHKDLDVHSYTLLSKSVQAKVLSHVV